MKASQKAEQPLLDFIKASKMESKMKAGEEYVPPSVIVTSKYGAKQFGWPATCPTCKVVSCIFGVSRDGLCLLRKHCLHPGATTKVVSADDPYIRKFHEKSAF